MTDIDNETGQPIDQEISVSLEWKDRLQTAYAAMVEASTPSILHLAAEVWGYKQSCESKPGTPGTVFESTVKEWINLDTTASKRYALVGAWMEKAIGYVRSAHVLTESLPPSYTTIYEITQIPEKKVIKYLEDGTINSQMTRADVKPLKPKASPRKKTINNSPEAVFSREFAKMKRVFEKFDEEDQLKAIKHLTTLHNRRVKSRKQQLGEIS